DEEKVVDEGSDKKDGKNTKDEEKDANKKGKDEKADKTKVDLEDINNRIVALPLQPGYYLLDGAAENKLVYMRGRTIGVYDLSKLENKDLIENTSGFAISADGKKMIYRANNDFFIVDAGQKPTPGSGKIEIKDVKQLVDPEAEWKQVFHEVWAMQKEFFYVENMHGVAWNAMKVKYERFLPYVGHRSVLGYLLNELMGEMVVGHNYIYPGDQPATPSVNTATSGADLAQTKEGYRIAKIATPLDCNPSSKAPLAEPGSTVRAGDLTTAINGIPLTAGSNTYRSLENAVNRRVSLKIKGATGREPVA